MKPSSWAENQKGIIMSNTEGKYIIHATIRCDGTVARKDVVGAIWSTEAFLAINYN